MGLTTQEQILIEQRVTNEAKSMFLAYVIWFFATGLFGLHRLYLGRRGSGFAMLALAILGVLMIPSGGSIVVMPILLVWWLVDAFLIPGMVQRHKNDVRNRLSANFAKGLSPA